MNYSKEYNFFIFDSDDNLISLGFNLNTIPIYNNVGIDLDILYNTSDDYNDLNGSINSSIDINNIFQLNVGLRLGNGKDKLYNDRYYNTWYYIGLNTEYYSNNINLYYFYVDYDYDNDNSLNINYNINKFNINRTFKLSNNIDIETNFTSIALENVFAGLVSQIYLPITINYFKIIPSIECIYVQQSNIDGIPLKNFSNYGINITIPF